MAYYVSDDEDKDTYSDDDFGFKRFSLPYVPEPSDDKVTKTIKKVMEEKGVQAYRMPPEPHTFPPNIDKKSKRYFETKGLGWFCCPQQHHRWSSAHSWCYIDLKKQRICYRDEQKCRKNDCEMPVSPEFSEAEIEKMAEYAVSQFFMRLGRKKGRRGGGWRGWAETFTGANDKPHDQKRCGRCKRLGRKCWTKF